MPMQRCDDLGFILLELCVVNDKIEVSVNPRRNHQTLLVDAFQAEFHILVKD